MVPVPPDKGNEGSGNEIAQWLDLLRQYFQTQSLVQDFVILSYEILSLPLLQ